MAEPNPMFNVFGGGGDGLTSKATNSLKSMNDAGDKLVSQLKEARTILTQMEKSAQNIASSLRGVGGGGAGSTSGVNYGGVGNTGNNLLRQTTFSVMGQAVGMAAGRALGGVQNNMLQMSDIATFTRQWNPGRFSGPGAQGAALRSLMPNMSAGQDALDAMAAYRLQGAGFTGQNLANYTNDAARISRITGMSYADSVSGAAGFQNMSMVWKMRQNGIQIRNPRTGAFSSPQQIAAQIYSRGNLQGMNAQQREDALSFSLRDGGRLNRLMSGLDPNTQQSVIGLLRLQASGKDINSPDFKNYRAAQANRATASANAQSGMVDAADNAYSATANTQTAMLNTLTSIDQKLGNILYNMTGGAMGAGSAMGINATGIGSGMIGNLIASRIGSRLGGGAGAAGAGAAGAGASRGGIRGMVGGALRYVGRGSLLKGIGKIGAGALLGPLADQGGGWLRNQLEGINGGVDPNDDSFGAKARRFGTFAYGVGQGAAVGASMGMIFGPWGAGVGAGIGTLWGAYQGLTDWSHQGGNYGTVAQDNPNSLATSVPSGGGASSGDGGSSSAGGGGSAAAGGVIGEAMKWIGTPYSWGGGGINGPSKGTVQGANTVGFDCSSFVQYVFHKFGVNLPRTSQAQAGSGKEVPRKNAAKGDLLIFSFPGENNGHVAIYLGGDRMIHAPHTGAKVSTEGVPWNYVSHIRRVIGSAQVGGGSASNGKGSSQTTVGTSGTGANIGSSGGGPYWTGQGVIYYGGDPGATASSNNPAAAAGNATPGSVGKAAPAGQVKGWIDSALQILGKDRNTFEAGLYSLIMHESTGNPRAQNNWDSNAKAGHPSKGLMQTIDSTFNQYSINGHKNIWNPVDNIIAGFRYAEKNYGDNMIEAGGRHDSHGKYLGYSEGAWRINKDQDARIHEGEMILPKAMAESMRTAIREGFSTSNTGSAPVQVTMNVTINGASEKTATDLVRKFEQTVTRARSTQTIRRR